MGAFDWKRPATLGAFGKSLRKAREKRGLTLEELAGETGISKPYLANIETATAPGPASEPKLRKLARALGLEEEAVVAGADWLRTPASVRKVVAQAESADLPRRSDGSVNLDAMMGDQNRKLKIENGKNGDGMALVAVPLINRVAAGKASEFTDLSYPAGVADTYVGVPDMPEAKAGAMFAVKVLGDSMMPEYREGEVIVVSSDGTLIPRDGDDCVVPLGEMEHFATTFKRIFFEKDETGEAVGVRLVPLNGKHAERKVKMTEVTGIYPMVYRLVPRRTAVGAGRVKASEKLLWE